MNTLAWMMSLGILIFLLAEAVVFHKATVCRQEAWLKGTEMRTRALLSDAPEEDKDWHVGCKLFLKRKKEIITWRKLPSILKKEFVLELEGTL